jgi:mono/diheme cytochrome c family protein
VPLALNGWEVGLLASAFVFISFALFVALVVPRFRPGFPGRGLGWFIGGAIVLFAVQLTAVLLLASHENKNEEASPSETTTQSTPTETGSTQTTPTESGPTSTTPAPGGQGDAAAGKQIFAAQPCGGCHTLADAGTSGNVGPNLDQAKPPFALVVERVTNGKSPMPSFKGTLTEQQIRDVAAYVSSVAGKS